MAMVSFNSWDNVFFKDGSPSSEGVQGWSGKYTDRHNLPNLDGMTTGSYVIFVDTQDGAFWCLEDRSWYDSDGKRIPQVYDNPNP